MNESTFPVYLIPLGFIVIFPLFWALVVTLVAFVGGWQRIAAVYPAKSAPRGQRFSWQTLLVGYFASYRSVVNIQIDLEGLYLSTMLLFRPGHRPIFIPWDAIAEVSAGRSALLPVVTLTLRNPPTTSLPKIRVFYEKPCEAILAALPPTVSVTQS